MQQLTKAQRDPLFELVRLQQDLNQESRFFAIGDRELLILPEAYLPPEQAIRIPREMLDLWAAAKYISLSEQAVSGPPRSSDVLTFILRQEAIDYADRMSQDYVVRTIARLRSILEDKGRELIWGVIIAVCSAIVVHLLRIR